MRLLISILILLAASPALAQKTPGQLQQEWETCAQLNKPQPCHNTATEVQDVISTFTPETGTSAPIASAVYVGQTFTDTAHKVVYVSVSTGNGAADWVIQTPSGGNGGTIGTRSGSGAPAASANGIGQFYIDTAGGFTWVAKSAGNGAADWIPSTPFSGINIKAFGAVGNNTKDDTASIQAAIDFAYNNHIQKIYCPDGQYKISGNSNAIIYLDPPNNLRSNWASPPLFSFSLAFEGPSAGTSNQTRLEGCQLFPTTNNNVAFIIGPGEQMRVSRISVIGPNNAYRGNLNTGGIGIGVGSNGGGAHQTTIEDVDVESFYVGIQLNANGGCCLVDSNTIIRPSIFNAFEGIAVTQTQTDITTIYEPVIQATIAISNVWTHNVKVLGGNPSATSGQGNSVAVSSISAFTFGTGSSLCANQGTLQFTATLSADGNIPNVYNSWMAVTSHFGVIPFNMTAFNANTHVGSFETTCGWLTGNYPTNVAPMSLIQADVQALSTFYATERLTVILGQGTSAENLHIENASACTTFYDNLGVFGGSASANVREVLFNYDPGLTTYQPAATTNPTQLAYFYCQQEFPFITNYRSDSGTLTLEGGEWGQGGGNGGYFSGNQASVLFESSVNSSVTFINAHDIRPSGPSGGTLDTINQRLVDFWSLITVDTANNYGQNETLGNGAGQWDYPTNLPHGFGNQLFYSQCAFAARPNICEVSAVMTRGPMTVPYWGYRPKPNETPIIPPSIFSTVCNGGATPCGAFGTPALGSYPPIDCQTVYRVGPQWNSGALTKLFARSAHCPGYSWGQNLTTALEATTFSGSISGTTLTTAIPMTGRINVGDVITGAGIAANTTVTAVLTGVGFTGTYTVNNSQTVASETMTATGNLTWTYMAGSDVLYLDPKTLDWVFPGLAFTIQGGTSPNTTSHYIVMETHPQLGYITVVDVDDNFANGPHAAPLQGTSGTVYSCSSSCTLGQAAYSWTQY